MKRYDKELLKDFWNKWLQEQGGKQPTSYEWDNESYPSYKPIKREFGSWSNFVKEMGGNVLRRNKTKKMLEVEVKIGTSVEYFLEEEYDKGRKTGEEISKIIDKDPRTVIRWIEKFGISKRSRGEVNYARTKYTKDNLIEYWNKWILEHDGKQPTQDKWEANDTYPSIPTIRKHYKNWNNFVREVGGKVNLSRKNCHSTCTIEEGIKAYFRYTEKCKAESKKPTTLHNFFLNYNPYILKRAEGVFPLKKDAQRYYKKMKKLREKLEEKLE